MDEKLSKEQDEYIDKLKRLKLLENGIDYSDVDVYVKYLQADDEAEIEQEAAELVADIKQQNTTSDAYHDETVWKPF